MVHGVSGNTIGVVTEDRRTAGTTAREFSVATDAKRTVGSKNSDGSSAKPENIEITTKSSGVQDVFGGTTPHISLGYIGMDGKFKRFCRNEVNLFRLEKEDFRQEDHRNMVFAETLGKGRAEVSSDTKIVVLTHPEPCTLSPGTETEFFPSIWARRDLLSSNLPGNTSHISLMQNTKADARNYIEGAESGKFVLVGLTIQAPYYSGRDYAWKVYVYSPSLTSATSNDSSLTSFIRWMNPYMIGHAAGADALMRLQEQSVYMNTIPIIPKDVKDIRSTMAAGIAEGLIYMAPNSRLCHGTENIPLVFKVEIPQEHSSGVKTGAEVGFYFNNSPAE